MKKLPFAWRHSARVLALVAVGSAAANCNSIDTTRKKKPEATFGDDMYGVLCDRVGAQSFQEDLSGASYRPVCHYDAEGNYGDTVDVSLLPSPKSDVAIEARRIAIAKMEALARRRSDLVRAFNAIFPDIDIDNVATPEDGDTIRLHDALLALGQHIVPLYDSNPYDPGGEPLTPATTRALGHLFDSIATTQDAKDMLAEMWGRQGYRPYQVGLGAMRATLSYPNLRSFTTSSLGVLGPQGSASPQLQELLAAGKQAMLHAKVDTESLPPLMLSDPNTAQLNRPRTTIEFVRDMLLSQSDAFANDPSDPQRFIALRDKRGFVIPAGNQPGVAGTVPSPFVDLDGDGFADVDDSGRFLDASGAPLDVARPFAIPGIDDASAADEYGRLDPNLYTYVDTSRTLAAGLMRQMQPLLDATQYSDPGDPEAFTKESETLMYAIAGMYDLLGSREDAEYDFDNDKVVPLGTGCDACFKYSRFRGEDSPLADLAHAAGQVIGDQDSDAMLLGMIDLLQNHEQEVARLVGAALRVKEISDQYDDQVAAGQMPPASLPYENPIWDQVAQVVSRIAGTPGLTSELVGALADDTVVTPIDGSSDMGDAVGAFASYRDQMTYDPYDLNGPALNLSVGPQSISDPVTPVNYNAPRNGDNRSLLERAVLLIHDARHAKACNKNGAKVKTSFGIDWPIGSSYDECQLFEMPDLAAFYLDSLLPAGHPKRSVLNLKSDALNSLLAFLSNFGLTADQMFHDSSGIDGMTLHPEPRALNRLVWFGADSDDWGHLPDYDSLNDANGNGPYSDTSAFVHALMEPASPIECPPNGNGVGVCSNQADLFRMRDGNSIFTWERLGFYPYLRPLVTKFANVTCNADVSFCTPEFTGESMFIDLTDILWTHWPGPDHGPECDTSGKYGTNPRYCSGAGVNRYEPIISKAGRTDLIPALHEFAKAAYDVSKITVARGPNAGMTMTGADVLELTTKILFSQDYAASVQMVDRHGKHGTTWTDGTPQAQLTAFNLFTDGLHGLDAAFDANGEDGALRKRMWKRARSQLVDALMAVDGDGPTAHFKSKSTAPLLIAILKLVREQVNAHCPNRESGVECTWAKKDLGKNLADEISTPVFASMIDLGEAMRQDENARRELERYMSYLLASASDGDALQGTLASMTDVMQVLADDARIVPILQAAAVAANPDDDPNPGCADRTIRVLTALTDDKYDKYHVMDYVLRNLVTPIDDGGPTALTPLEIIMDSIADIHRLDPSVGDPLTPDDYGAIMGTVRDFLTDKQRGLEQFYAIINNRQRQ